ncbi:MAG: vWA domain-containing protein, partial [Rickettsiales bacterium]
DIEEILKDPSEEGAENAELKEAQQKYQNICHAVNMCFFQHNGLFEDTPEGWKSVGVRTDWITEDPDYPDATGQTPGEALKYIQALCREMEETQPHASDKRYGPKKLAKLIDEHMDRRNEIAEEIWERYAKQFAQPVIDKAEEQTKERLEENKQKQEQQQQDQQQDQQEGGEQGENQEGEGEGQGQGQEGQEGQGQGQGQGDSSGQQSGDSGGQSDPSDLGGQQGGNSDDGLTVEGHNSPMEDQTAERPEDRQEAASGKGEEQEQDGQEQGDGQEGAGEEQGQEQEGQGQKGEGEGEEQGEGQSQGENGTEQGVGEGQSQGQDGNQQGQEEGEGQGEGEDGQTIEELLEEREQRKEEARKQEEEAKKKAKEAASKQKGGKADSAGSSYGLDNLPVGDWSDYTNTVQEYQGPIYEVAQMLEDLKKDYYEEQLSEDDHQLLPQGGDLSRFDPKRQLRLRQIIGTQRQPERDDFNFFTADEDCPTPIIDDVVIMIDVSGSMSSGNTRQRPIDMAVQAGCIWMEAGKMVGTNVRVFAWGSKDGPVLVASPDMDEETIGKNIMGMVKAAGGGTDLAPGIKGVNAALADKDNYRHMDLNAMSGGTHMIVVSDGDIFDSPEAQAEFEKTLENNPKVTTDWMI